MVSKKELMERICDLETNYEFIYDKLDTLEKKLKKIQKESK